MDLRSIQRFRADFLANLYTQASVNCPVTTESHKQNSSGAAFCQITWGFHSAPSSTSTHWLRLLDTKQLPLVSVCQQACEREDWGCCAISAQLFWGRDPSPRSHNHCTGLFMKPHAEHRACQVLLTLALEGFTVFDLMETSDRRDVDSCASVCTAWK